MIVSACYLAGHVQFSGVPCLQGPQQCDDKQAPIWVGEVFEKHPEIDVIAINSYYKDNERGVIYYRIKKEGENDD